MRLLWWFDTACPINRLSGDGQRAEKAGEAAGRRREVVQMCEFLEMGLWLWEIEAGSGAWGVGVTFFCGYCIGIFLLTKRNHY